jgi:hypothetical protein
MTRDERLINVLTEWLEDQPERAPDQLLDTVLIDLQAAPQRAYWRLAFRRFPMLGSNLARYGAVAGVAALAVFIGVGLWAGAGPPVGPPGGTSAPTLTSAATPTTAPTPTSAATATTTLPATAEPSPIGLRGQGLLAAGAYAYEGDGVGITLTVPAGWESIVRNLVGKGLVTGPARVQLSFHQTALVFVDPCRPEAGVQPTETAEDLATALAEVAFAEVTPPMDTTIDGFRGKHLAWTVEMDTPGNLDLFLGCGGPWQFASYIHSGLPTRSAVDPVAGKHQDVWILDVAGTRLVIDATYSSESSDADRAELQAVIDSLDIEALDE